MVADRTADGSTCHRVMSGDMADDAAGSGTRRAPGLCCQRRGQGNGDKRAGAQNANSSFHLVCILQGTVRLARD
jgi:hypothetical protein